MLSMSYTLLSAMGFLILLLSLFSMCYSEDSFNFIFKNGRYFGKANRNLMTTTNPNISSNYFEQKLDHFSNDTRVWNQFYFANDQFYKPGGPAFIFIGGEGETGVGWIDPNAGLSDWLKNAQKYEAMCFVLEHRYYGKSRPTEDLSTSNLKWLSSKQALADIASFIDGMKLKFPQLTSAKWIVFGGSYAGMLAAWFREKYPQYAAGAIASSAPVLAQLDFKEYYEVVGNALNRHSPACADTIAIAVRKLGEMRKARIFATIQRKFKLCNELDPTNSRDVTTLLQNVAEMFAGLVQYNKNSKKNFNINKICTIMTDSSIGDELDRYAATTNFILQYHQYPCLDFNYEKMIRSLKQVNKWESATRQWMYQVCTEFGFFQTSDSTQQPFGRIDDFPLSYHLQQCRDIFGNNITNKKIVDAISSTNDFYGGRNLPKTTNVVLPNGSLDPWYPLSILNDIGPDIRSIFIEGMSHCRDMQQTVAGDSQPLIDARLEITEWLAYFLGKTKKIPKKRSNKI